MLNIFNDTVSKRACLVTLVAILIGMLLVFVPDTDNVHGGGIITALGGLFLIGLSFLGLVLFLVIRFLSK